MDLLPGLLTKALASSRYRSVRKGQTLQYKGETVGDVMIIKEGVVKIYDIDEQGNEKILHLLKCPAVFPFAFFTGDDTIMRWSYAALTDCEIYILPKATLLELLEQDNNLTLYLMNWFSSEVHEIMSRLSSLNKTLARDKLVAALHFLAVWHSTSRSNHWVRVTFPVSHQLLADITGITRESATLALKELQAEHVIRRPRATTLEINQTALAKLS